MENAAGARRMPARHVPRGFECHPVLRLCAVAAIVAFPCGCNSASSALAPSGVEAQLIANTFWLMTAGAIVIWLAVVILAIRAASSGRSGSRAARRVIIGGGVVLPVVVLTALLVHGLSLMPKLRPAPSVDSLRIDVSGEQWWWRVRYAGDVMLANEIRLPLGERVEIRLSSPDVIHSFWIPALAGKMDMTPGRDTTLAITPTKTGVFHGACAEFCGTSHAHMRIVAVVMEPDAFSRWLVTQALDAKAPANALARRGAQAFLVNGCGACHTIRGTAADGVIGPDLTHVGSRASLAAGTLENDREDFVRWISHPQAIKPGALMPSFAMLPADDIEAIAAYLDGLE